MQLYCQVQKCKNFEHWSTFTKVMPANVMVQFFGPPCIIIQKSRIGRCGMQCKNCTLLLSLTYNNVGLEMKGKVEGDDD